MQQSKEQVEAFKLVGQINAGIVHYVNTKVRKLIEAESSASDHNDQSDNENNNEGLPDGASSDFDPKIGANVCMLDESEEAKAQQILEKSLRIGQAIGRRRIEQWDLEAHDEDRINRLPPQIGKHPGKSLY